MSISQKETHNISQRIGEDEILALYQAISVDQNIVKIVNALPYATAILNEQRQLIYTNEKLFDLLNGQSILEILGKRPGEIINCIHASKGRDLCGTSKHCEYCGALQAVVRSQKNRKKITTESRITIKKNEEEISFDFNVTAAPFKWNEKNYTIVSIVDISSEKRRRALEKIFFHDVLNVATSLSSFFNLLRGVDNPDRLRDLMEIAESLSDELVEELQAQQTLMSAEKGELETHPRMILSLEFLKDTVSLFKNHQLAQNKHIEINPESDDVTLSADTTLLKRVLINMLKNAIEATRSSGVINTGCYLKNNDLLFYVQNNSVMSEEVQMQVFQRSFSTKSSDRGMGTYSMKLLGENYLGGKIGFTSKPKTGTIFQFSLPID